MRIWVDNDSYFIKLNTLSAYKRTSVRFRTAIVFKLCLKFSELCVWHAPCISITVSEQQKNKETMQLTNQDLRLTDKQERN